MSMRDGDAVPQGREDAIHRRGREDTVLQVEDAICRGRTLFVEQDAVWRERTPFVEGGRIASVRQGRDTVCQRGMEDTVSRQGRMPFVEDKLKNVVGRKNNKFPRWEIQSST